MARLPQAAIDQMDDRTVRVGLLGGTFDPIHQGHLQLAQAALRVADLERVYLVTSVRPPHKTRRTEANFLDRHAMVALAAIDQPRLVPSSLEHGREGKSYSVDTIRQFRKKLGAASEVFFILGIDTFLDISSWKDFESLPRLCRFLVFARPGFDESRLTLRIPEAFLRSVCLIDGRNPIPLDPHCRCYLYREFSNPVSSSEVRERIRRGQTVKEMLPPAVLEYIGKNRLYSGD
ncbi:MAG: nicotinate (nicotinamide) nucleotide adenylyltransferase [Acidobacteria bacterium]|nr:nicotinate (nicotinamide) nucleotide adenylyltransferase [Acidobacteriota bacterium]